MGIRAVRFARTAKFGGGFGLENSGGPGVPLRPLLLSVGAALVHARSHE